MRVACPIDSMGYIKKNAEDAEYLAFFDIEEEEILSEEKAPLSIHDISSILKLKDVDVFICTNMDIPLMVSLSKNDIEIVGGASGKAKNVIHSWMDGTLDCDDLVCSCQENGGCSGDCSHCKSL